MAVKSEAKKIRYGKEKQLISTKELDVNRFFSSIVSFS